MQAKPSNSKTFGIVSSTWPLSEWPSTSPPQWRWMGFGEIRPKKVTGLGKHGGMGMGTHSVNLVGLMPWERGEERLAIVVGVGAIGPGIVLRKARARVTRASPRVIRPKGIKRDTSSNQARVFSKKVFSRRDIRARDISRGERGTRAHVGLVAKLAISQGSALQG